MRSGTLHNISCSHCEHQAQVGLPLLVFRLDDDPPVLFSSRLVSGTYSLFRNPCHHKIVEDDAYFSHNLVAFIGALMNFIDESEERKEPE